jgi:hypothetical protein
VPEYRQRLWDSRLEELFDDDDREQVLSWLLEVGERKRVIVVGAGFTKNAKTTSEVEIPNWDELTRRMARHLRLKREEGHDPLELADLFEVEHSRDALESWLIEQLDDDALVTGAAHRALWESSPQAVITTNFLDTALEKPISSVGVPIYECSQLAKPLGDVKRHLIYFHGHRSAPETWVTSRRDYEDLPRKRPAIHIKVRQLLAEFPAVVVGYSMRDPDFHFRSSRKPSTSPGGPRRVGRVYSPCWRLGTVVELKANGGSSELACFCGGSTQRANRSNSCCRMLGRSGTSVKALLDQ